MGEPAKQLCYNENQRRVFVYSRRDDAGFGSQLTVLTGAIKWATDHNRAFVHDQEGWLSHTGSNPYCPRRSSTDCFFENASICNLPKSLYTSNYIARPNRLATSDLGLPIVRVRGSKGLEMDIPLEQWNPDYPFLQGLCRLMILNERTRLLLQKVLYEALSPQSAELLAQGEYIAVHIRRGDKLISDMGYLPTGEYANAIREVHKAAVIAGTISSSRTVVFIMTDALSEVSNLQKELGPEWHVVALKFKRNTNGYEQISVTSPFSEAIGLLAELTISSRASGVVVTLQSNVSVLLRALWVCNGNWDSPVINLRS